MNDGVVHILGHDVLENGCKVEISIHEWPNGYRNECKIFFSPDHHPEESLKRFVDSSFEKGHYVKRIQ